MLAWHLGHRDGVRRGADEAGREAVAREREARAGTAERLAELEASLAVVVRERDVARATVAALRDELERADRLDADERAELELYRRVGGEALPGGLSIDSIERRRARPGTLAITLVQARGRDRVAGRVELRSAADGDGTVDGVGAGELLDSVRFDLRFFETLELSFGSARVPVPDTLVVSVVPDGGRHEPFRTQVDVASVRIVD